VAQIRTAPARTSEPLRPRPLLLAAVLLACCAYGLALAVLKGDVAGWRFVVGNLSAPYVIPPFLLGRSAASKARALGAGAAAVVTTLAGFYLWEAAAFDLINRHTVAHVVLITALGLLLGPVFGLLGWISRRRLTGVVVLALVTPFLAEPLVQVLPGQLGNLRGDPVALRQYPYIFAAETILGCAGVLLLLRRGDRVS
jgi:hypothetical protein